MYSDSTLSTTQNRLPDLADDLRLMRKPSQIGPTATTSACRFSIRLLLRPLLVIPLSGDGGASSWHSPEFVIEDSPAL
jgi:hypothetical protein